MAWITQDSANTKIHRRDEPYLTEQMRKELVETIIPRYERKQGATMPALHMIQHAYGHVPHQAMVEIAELLDLKPADVIDTASFYEEYWLKQKGEHVIAVCRSIACEFCGSDAITRRCTERLGIEPGETTDDGKFTLVELECLGSCGTAPVALCNHTLHENLTVEGVDKLIDDAASGNVGGH